MESYLHTLCAKPAHSHRLSDCGLEPAYGSGTDTWQASIAASENHIKCLFIIKKNKSMLIRQLKSDAKENTLEIQFKILHTAIYEEHYTDSCYSLK